MKNAFILLSFVEIKRRFQYRARQRDRFVRAVKKIVREFSVMNFP